MHIGRHLEGTKNPVAPWLARSCCNRATKEPSCASSSVPGQCAHLKQHGGTGYQPFCVRDESSCALATLWLHALPTHIYVQTQNTLKAIHWKELSRRLGLINSWYLFSWPHLNRSAFSLAASDCNTVKWFEESAAADESSTGYQMLNHTGFQEPINNPLCCLWDPGTCLWNCWRCVPGILRPFRRWRWLTYSTDQITCARLRSTNWDRWDLTRESWSQCLKLAINKSWETSQLKVRTCTVPQSTSNAPKSWIYTKSPNLKTQQTFARPITWASADTIICHMQLQANIDTKK